MELKQIIYKLNRKQTQKSCENLQSFVVATVFDMCRACGISTSIECGLDFAFKKDEIGLGKSIVKNVLDDVLFKLNPNARDYFLYFLENDQPNAEYEVVE